MTRISEQDLRTLMSHVQPHSVSLFMPTHPAGAEKQQGPIRMKNLVKQAEAQLTDLGVRSSEAARQLAPAREVLDDLDFWSHQSRGLAVFLGNGRLHTFRVPFPLEELAVVSDRFHMTPLLPLVTSAARFYVLGLSQQKVQLWEATEFAIHPVELPDAPRSFQELARFDDQERHVEYHTGTAQGGAMGAPRPAVFHGQGEGADEAVEKRRLTEFARKVQHAVYRRLAGDTAPLLLAATDPLMGIYRELNRYGHLHERPLGGSPDHTEAAEYHRLALKVLTPAFDTARERAISHWRTLAGTARTADQVARIVTAADDGAVESLLLSLEDHAWGRYDHESRAVDVHGQRLAGDLDLLGFAAVRTFLSKGTVFALKRDEMPDSLKAAATLRFATPAT